MHGPRVRTYKKNQAFSPEAHKLFSNKISEHYLQLIEKAKNPEALLKQVQARDEEYSSSEMGTDAVGDSQAMKTRGVIQKYKNRILLVVSGSCAANCRYCFRRHMDYGQNKVQTEMLSALSEALKELQGSGNENPIREVILSGGDPLMQDDDFLHKIFDALDRFNPDLTLRIHSRMAVFAPERFTKGLLELLSQRKSPLVFVHHINHPEEIAESNRFVFEALKESSIQQLNQSVLLRGVNDSADTLESLSWQCQSVGVLPYYLHQLDRVRGVEHFQVTTERGLEIIKELRRRLPGYLVPRFVQEIAGEAYKVPLA